MACLDDNFTHTEQRMRRIFVTGLFVILPLIITLWIIGFVFDVVQSFVLPIVLQAIHVLGFSDWLEQSVLRYLAPLLSVIMAICGIYLVGLIGSNVFGRQFLRWFEILLLRVPIVRSIYSATRQFFDTFSTAGSRAFRQVVVVQYPYRGVWMLGFVTNTDLPKLENVTANRIVSVFLPTTPNPTSGWLVFVPHDDVVVVDMSIDDAFKLIISGGVLTNQSSIIKVETTT